MCRSIFVMVMCLALVFQTACTKPGETTAVGAATGGALGAGVGALIGNQTGNTGDGFVVGALAGSGAGAAVGNALEAQENAIRLQDEAIERQDRLISTQRSEIQELRHRSQDQVSFKDDLRRELGPPPLSNNRYGQGISDSTASIENEIPPLNNDIQDINSGGRAALRPAEDYSNALKAPQPKIPTSEPVLKKGSYDGARGSQYASGVQEQDIPLRRVPVMEEAPDRPQGIAPGTEMETAEVTSAQSVNNSADCQKASKEISAANVASEMSDKLFHYRRALRLCPGNADFHNGLGEIYVSLRRYDDARYEFNEALRLNPSLTTARSNLLDLPRTY